MCAISFINLFSFAPKIYEMLMLKMIYTKVYAQNCIVSAAFTLDKEIFCMNFISRLFYFLIIQEFLNSQARFRLTKTDVFNISENF